VPGNVDVVGGYAYSQSSGQYPTLTLRGLSTDLLTTNGIPTATSVQPFTDVEESKLISFFGRLNYNLNDRWLAAVSLRRDGSSRFGPSNAWGNFPSVAVAWRISQEPFLSGLSSLSELKLRASWGRTGNQNFANYQQYSTYVVGDASSAVQFGNQFVSTIRPSAVDPNIKARGIGKRVVEALETEALENELHAIFAFTYVPEFFRRLGFQEVERGELPLKVWKDCLRCPKFQCCDEIAVVKALRPDFVLQSAMEPEANLIQLPHLKPAP